MIGRGRVGEKVKGGGESKGEAKGIGWGLADGKGRGSRGNRGK